MFKALKAKNGWQNNGTDILHLIAQHPIDQVQVVFVIRVFGLHVFRYTHRKTINIKKIVRFMMRSRIYLAFGHVKA